MRNIFTAEAKMYLFKLYLYENSLFDDKYIDLNFLEHHPNQQVYNLRHDNYGAKFNRDFSGNGENDNTYKIIKVNTRSKSANGTYFVAYLETLDLKFNIMCLTETWGNEGQKVIYKFPNYNSFHFSRPLRDGGGVLLLVGQELNASEIRNTSHNSNVLECMFVEVADTDQNFPLCCCYGPQPINDSSCFTKLSSEMLHSIS